MNNKTTASRVNPKRFIPNEKQVNALKQLPSFQAQVSTDVQQLRRVMSSVHMYLKVCSGLMLLIVLMILVSWGVV